ncbi:MAG: cobalt-precorrin-5B (C(1))-methyltransferase, partial [Methylocella sp.]
MSEAEEHLSRKANLRKGWTTGACAAAAARAAYEALVRRQFPQSVAITLPG